MNWQEIAAIVGFFALRILVPLLVTIGIGELVSRTFSARRRSIEEEGSEAARQGYSLSPQCWEVKNCDPAVRESCPAYRRPNVPCWMALQLSGNELPEECFACEVFRLAQAVKVDDTVTPVQGG
jgi:hypothetical protein